MPEFDDEVEITGASLTSLRNGALVEMFDIEMQRIAKNIADPNTSAKKKRAITIKIEFQPNEERGAAVCGIQVTPTLAPIKPAATTVYFRELHDGRVDITEYNPKQPTLPMGVAEIKKTGAK